MADGPRTTPMQHSARERQLLALSIVLGAIPFAFAIIRAVRTGYDLRYLWVACASLAGAVIVSTAARSYSGTLTGMVVLSAGTFVVATQFAVVMASWLGAAIGPGSVLVGSAFGFCCAASRSLYALAHTKGRAS